MNKTSRFITTLLFISITAVLISSYHITIPRRSTDILKKKLNFLNSESRDKVYSHFGIRERKIITSFASIQPSFDSSRYSVTFPSGTFENIATLYTRCSWISWWIQIILSVVAGVILTFANSVRQSSEKGAYFLWTSGFVFSTTGVIISLVSSLWTWNMTRLKRRLLQNKIKENVILPTLKRSSKISVVLSLVGMFVTLLGAEQIVGTLASKVLLNPGFFPLASSTSQQGAFQALDIFLVQANTNVMVSHFACLVCYTYLQTQLPQLRYIAEPTTSKASSTTTTATKTEEAPPTP